MVNTRLYNAYLLDIEHGWHIVPELTLDEAVRYCNDYKQDWAGSAVAIAPYGADPQPYLDLVVKNRTESVIDAVTLRTVE